MPTLSEHDNDPQPKRGKRSLLVPVIVVVLVTIFVVLHLAGVFGPSSHQSQVPMRHQLLL
jgi:flagellar basal body-associated protein FliL